MQGPRPSPALATSATLSPALALTQAAWTGSRLCPWGSVEVPLCPGRSHLSQFGDVAAQGNHLERFLSPSVGGSDCTGVGHGLGIGNFSELPG